MSGMLNGLAQRRMALVARADQDRAALVESFSGIQRRLVVAETVVSTVRRMRRNRALLGAIAVFGIVAPLAARKWIRRASFFLPLVIGGVRLAREHRASGRG
jgi:hypothetical protein